MPQVSTNPQGIYDQIFDELVAVFDEIDTNNYPRNLSGTFKFGNTVRTVTQRYPDIEFEETAAPIIFVYGLGWEEKRLPSHGIMQLGSALVAGGVYATDQTDAQLALVPAKVRDLEYDVRRAIYGDPTIAGRVVGGLTKFSAAAYEAGISLPRGLFIMRLEFVFEMLDIRPDTHIH